MSLMLSVCLALTTGCRPHACGFESLQITCGNPCPQPALVTGCGVMYADECSVVSNEVCGPVVEKAPVIVADTAESLSSETGLAAAVPIASNNLPIGYSGRAWGYPGGGYGGGLGGGFGFGNGQGAPGRGFGIAGGGGGGRGGGSGNGSGNGTGSGSGTGTGNGNGTGTGGNQGQIQGVVVNITGPNINVSQSQTQNQNQQQQQQQQQGQGQFQNNNNNNGGHCGCRPPQNVPVPASAWFGVAGVVALVGMKRKRNAVK